MAGSCDVAAVKKLGETSEQLVQELRKSIVDMDRMIDEC